MGRFFLVFAFILSMTTTLLAYDVAGWDIKPYPEHGSAEGCIMSANYQDGTRLSILVSRTYIWALGLGNSTWNLAVNGSTDVAAYVDSKFVASGSAEHLSSNVAAMRLTGAEAFRALQVGHRLDLQTPHGNLTFSLAGTGKAMAAVLACVRGLERQQQLASEKTRDFQMLESAEATVVLTNMLNTAGVTGYKLNPPVENSNAITFTLADGTQGMFIASRGKNTASADNYASLVLGDLSKACNGEFLSGKQSIPSLDGSVIRKLVATCRTGEVGIVIESTIVRRPDGFLMELTHTVQGAAGSFDKPADEGTDRTALSEAAIKYSPAR